VTEGQWQAWSASRLCWGRPGVGVQDDSAVSSPPFALDCKSNCRIFHAGHSLHPSQLWCCWDLCRTAWRLAASHEDHRVSGLLPSERTANKDVGHALGQEAGQEAGQDARYVTSAAQAARRYAAQISEDLQSRGEDADSSVSSVGNTSGSVGTTRGSVGTTRGSVGNISAV